MRISVIRFGMVVSPDSFLSSVGCMIDAHDLAADRRRRLFLESAEKQPEVELTVMSINGQVVRVGGGVHYEVDRSIAPDDRFDFVWLPAFRFREVDMIQNRLASAGKLIDWLHGQIADGAILGVSGASIMYLMEGGFLEGRRVPVSRALQSVVRAIFPRCRTYCHEMVADYGNLLIANGIGNELALIADVMSRVISPDSGRWLAMVSGINREADMDRVSDPLVAAALLTLEYRYASDLTIAELAKNLSTTHQSLISRFKAILGMTPKVYLQKLRLAAAQRMLLNSRQSIDEIARSVGYSDPRAFREMFRKHIGETPSAWRNLRKHKRENSAAKL